MQNMSTSVSFEMNGDIAITALCNPPVNAGSHDLRTGVLSAVEMAKKAGAKGMVLYGDGSCFMAGSDLREFNKALGEPQLPAVIKALELAPFPIVAALHGVALGGGLELALGCDYRIAYKQCKLGLPEVSLGMIPGAGGTQRLTRFVGVAKAIELICGSKRLTAVEAKSYGFIDQVFENNDELVEEAISYLKIIGNTKRRTIDLSPPENSAEIIENAAKKALKRGGGRPNITQAIQLIRRASEPNAQTVLDDERKVFTQLRLGADAIALRHLFFAEREAGKVTGIDVKKANIPAEVAIIGAGTMGIGIGKSFLKAGFVVTFVEHSEEAMHASAKRLTDDLNADASTGRLDSDSHSNWVSRVNWTADLTTLTNCKLVVEAVFETMQIKQDLMQQLESIVSPSTTIATNTSYLDINEISEKMAHPERVLGLHFFSPAHIMKLLEIVRTEKTNNTTLAIGLAIARKLGKTSVVARVGEGFIGNRIYAAYRRRAEILVLDGASPQDVDAALQEFGFAMGVFAVSDMSGLDIGWAMRKRQEKTRDPKTRYVRLPDLICEAGRFGRKTGAGWYKYSGGKKSVDPEIEALIEAERKENGIIPRTYSAENIQRQLMATIVNEAACLLEEKIAQRPEDVDVVLANGYGFPRWRGGPLYWAKQQDRKILEADITELAEAIGHGFKRGPLNKILDGETK